MKKLSVILVILIVPTITLAQTANDFFNMAITEFRQGNYNQARTYFQKCIENKPEDGIKAEAYANIAAVDNLHGRYEEAIKNSNKSIEVSPSNIKAYVERGAANLAQGNRESSIKDFSTAIILDKENAFLYYRIRAFVHRGIARAGLGDYKGAILDYDTAIELGSNDTKNPEIMKAYMARGISKMSLGLFESGCSDLIMAGNLGSKESYEFANKMSKKYGFKCNMN